MKISLNWLRKYVEIDAEPAVLADMLTMSGFEVEAIIDPYAHLENVVVGRISRVKPHPEADRLTRCTVDAGNESREVVCGAPNTQTGINVPLALPGAMLPSGMRVAESRIRGQISRGMLCSEAELGLGPDDTGLMIIEADVQPGTPLSGALGLRDTIFEIGLTPNRPDCLSFTGVAREVAALLGGKMSKPNSDIPPGTGIISECTSVTIKDPELCPRYSARLITGITIGDSPEWLRKHLLSIGLKPINNIVDITNFVMMETGQPLHAFDFDRLSGHRIIVRTPDGENTFTTLDGKSRELASDTLMICDDEKPVAIAGVMGGENSEIEPATTRVLLESAYFNPTSIRRTSKRMGISTDASYRFERGIDPEGTIFAADRAAALMVEIAGGQLVEGIIDENPQTAETVKIRISAEKTNIHLGTELSAKQMIELLESVEFSVSKVDTDTLEVTVPSFRVDVFRAEDLMEEVARLWGYNNIVTTYPRVAAQTEPRSRQLTIKSEIRDLMAGFGFSETISYSFVGLGSARRLEIPDGDPRHNELPILNPLAETQAVMRTSLLPTLIETIQKNISRQERDLRLFELGKVFFSNGEEKLPDELDMLAGAWTGSRYPRSWHHKPEPCDFYDLKGIVEALLSGLGLNGLTYTPAFTMMPKNRCGYMRPGKTARILYGDKLIGSVGEVKPSVLKKFDVGQPVFSFEIDVDSLIDLLPGSICFSQIPRFPAVARDLTLIVDNRVETGEITTRVRAMDIELVEDLTVFDVYMGKPVPPDKKSISIRIVYRSHSGTLEDNRVNELHQKLTHDLMAEFGASLPA